MPDAEPPTTTTFCLGAAAAVGEASAPTDALVSPVASGPTFSARRLRLQSARDMPNCDGRGLSETRRSSLSGPTLRFPS